MRCKIRWIDPQGNFTPDNNPPVGEVYRKAYDLSIDGKYIHFEQTERFPICAAHARRLVEPSMHKWVFVPYIKADCSECGASRAVEAVCHSCGYVV